MSEPTVIGPGGGEVVGDAPDRRVEIISDHDALHATVSRFGPGRAGADLHVHRRHTDVFYVLAGVLTVRLGPGGDGVAVPAGTLARVPPLVVHGFANEGDEDLRYLNFHAPGVGFADYMRAPRDGRVLAYDQEPPPPDGGRPATEAQIGGAARLADGALLHADADEIAIAELTMGDADPAPRVDRHLVSLYVLEGELALTAGDRELRAPAGSWAQTPPGVPHAVRSAGAEPARVLRVRTPGRGA